MKYFLLLVMMISYSLASIGEITAINGTAYVIRGTNQIALQKHSKIDKKDTIKTLANTKLQIVFEDKTVISLGQKTTFSIDEYIYSQTKVKAHFSVPKGIFKSITGRIGKIDHSKFKLKTKNATIGVRGTTFIGVIEDNKESIACTSGEIVIQTPYGSRTVKKGEVSEVRRFTPPSTPKVLDKKFFKEVEAVKPEVNSENIDIKKIEKELNVENIIIKKEEVKSPFKSEKVVVKNESVKKIFENKKDSYNSVTKGHIEKIEKGFSKAKEGVSHVVEKVFSKGSGSSHKSFVGVDFGKFDDKGSHGASKHGGGRQEVIDKIQKVGSKIGDMFGDFASEEMAETDDTPQPPVDLPQGDELSSLIEKAGSSNLHFEGKVSGSGIKDDSYNKVALDFDLGKAQVVGNVKFKTGRYIRTNWNTNIAGSVASDGKFDFKPTTNRYSGSGSGELKGEHLDRAEGNFNFTKTRFGFSKSQSGTFTATR